MAARIAGRVAGTVRCFFGREFGPISAPPIKNLLFQILRGVCNGHSQKVLQPHNLLLDRQTYSLKLADFGLAGKFDDAPADYSYNVGTLAYKAPELILEMRQTTAAADIWPVGCIFADMMNGTPPFDLKTGVYVLRSIISILGVPTEIVWPGATSALREFCANGALQHPYFKTLLQNTQSCLSSLKLADFELVRTFDGAPAEYSHEVGTLAYGAPELILEIQQTIIAAYFYAMRGFIIRVVPTEIEGPEVALPKFCAPNQILPAAFPKYADGFSCLEPMGKSKKNRGKNKGGQKKWFICQPCKKNKRTSRFKTKEALDKHQLTCGYC